ncbi:MAG: hypothetical protein IJ309_07290 [Clostridia bacterium]|nr:hypothetical protein [Clostridia bacterium]
MRFEKMLKSDIKGSNTGSLDSIKARLDLDSGEIEPVLAMNNGQTKTQGRLSYLKVIIPVLLALVVAIAIYIIMPRDRGQSRFLIVDINPSFEIEYSADGKVVGVYPYNEDAEVVLANTSIKDCGLDSAVSQLFDKCVSLGYIGTDREDNAVLVSAVDEKGNKNEELTKEIKALFTKEFSTKKILGVVITGIVDSSLEKEASDHGVDVQKYAYIKEYIDMGGALDKEYKDVSIREIRSLIYEKEKEIKSQAISDIEKAKDDLKNGLQLSLKGILLEQIALFSQKPLENSEKIQAYQSYLQQLEYGELTDEEISSILSEITEGDEDGVLTQIAGGINEMLDKVSKAEESLSHLNKTPEQKANDQLDKVGPVKDGEASEVEKWQEEMEQSASSNWLENKDKWKNELEEIFKPTSPQSSKEESVPQGQRP